jgi:predicted nucleic acid-binding protein
MTVLPVRPPIPPEQVMLFVGETRDRLSLISLAEAEYVETIQGAGEIGLTGGRLYDALLLRCAEKAKAAVIYTWNLKHFRMIAPHLTERIRTP